MYLCDTIDTILGVAQKCVSILRLDGIKNIGKIVYPPIFNPNGTPKDMVGSTIFFDMCELHGYKFGLYTDDVIERFTALVMDELKRNIEHIEPYKVNKVCSTSHNVIHLLDTIIRSLIQYDTRYYI